MCQCGKPNCEEEAIVERCPLFDLYDYAIQTSPTEEYVKEEKVDETALATVVQGPTVRAGHSL